MHEGRTPPVTGASAGDLLKAAGWPDRSQASARGNMRTLLLRALDISPEIVIEQQSDRLASRSRPSRRGADG